jgi:enoyl-CoA hydratase
MLLTSDPITGTEAAQLGLANRAYPEADLLSETLTIAKKIAMKSPVSVKAAIDMLQYAKPASYYEGVKAEAGSFGTVFVSEDAKEGIQAFLEKRQAQFKGK